MDALMRPLHIVFCFIVFVGATNLTAQVSSDCTTAISICSSTPMNGGTMGIGIDDFNGANRSGCLEMTASGAIESNSAWYRFRTDAAGELGFNIGFDASEDWDFALYQSSDCSNLGAPIRCNFFDNSESRSYMGVGEDPTGIPNSLLYEDWLTVSPGEEYYLLINNFSATNTGFSIQFSGNIFSANPYDALDCTIVTNLLGAPITACEGDVVMLDATTTSAIEYRWFIDHGDGNGFQILNGETAPIFEPHIPGVYRVQLITTTGDIIESEVQVAFSQTAVSFPLTDVSFCSSTSTYDLSLKNGEVLGTQDPNMYSVSYHNSLASAISGNESLRVDHELSIGLETIFVRVTPLANPDCFDTSQEFEIAVVEAPELHFDTAVLLCENQAAITIGALTSNSGYTYEWDTGETSSSISVSEAGTYTLTATHNTCTTVRSVNVVISEIPQILEVIINDIQNNNTVTIVGNQEGLRYQLDNGPVGTSNVFQNVLPGSHTVTLTDANGCGTVTENIVVVGNPNYFTPNGDGFNDIWNISGLETLEDPQVFIYDRHGKLLKQLDAATIGWDGTANGQELPATDYWFLLTYRDGSGQRISAPFLQSHFSLRR